jgi:murein DD-endopeptidase MepM/ murein hydrolase activator NlpD
MSPTHVRPKHPIPPPPSPPVVPPSPPPPASALAGLTGTVKTKRPNSNAAYSIPWANIARWEPRFTQAASEFGVDPKLIAAMAIIESDANHFSNGLTSGTRAQVITRDDGFGDGLSVGMMQVKPQIWQSTVPSADAYTPVGNIRLGAAIMAKAIRAQGSWEQAIRKTYFPATDPNGTTQQAYVDTVRALMAEMSGTTPAPSPPPPPPVPVDPIRVIVGGDYQPITYGFLSDVGINSYAYVVGHGGTRSTQHSGVDVPVPHGTKLYTPLAGTVTCVGDAGQVIWGEGCGAFHDDMYGGIGNITVKFEGFDLKMTLGHCHTCIVALGSHVAAGQQVGTSGGSNGDHVHVDLATLKNGSYWLLDARGPELAAAMGGVAPVTYADPVDVPQPDDAPPYVIVRAIRPTPVLQRANPAAPPIFEPLLVGTTFHAQERVIGADGRWYWVGRLRGRVAEADTEVVEVVTA